MNIKMTREESRNFIVLLFEVEENGKRIERRAETLL